jgi:hypothetical protein
VADLTLDTIDAYLDTLVGLHAPDERYVELLMPAAIEPPENRAAARQAAPITLHDGTVVRPWSSCALLVRAVWRLLGVQHPILAAPYRSGHAVSDVETIARDLGAWHEPDDPTTPTPLAAVLVGDVGHEHVYLARTLDPLHGAGMHVTSLDGGQGPNGCAIETRARLWPSWSDRWRDVNDLGLGRPVRGWADTGRML